MEGEEELKDVLATPPLVRQVFRSEAVDEEGYSPIHSRQGEDPVRVDAERFIENCWGLSDTEYLDRGDSLLW